MTQMLALRGLQNEKRPQLVQAEVPEVGDDDVLVKIGSAGLTAGTFTLLEIGMLRPLPMTLGHEGAGTVEAVGRDVRHLKPGDRVRIHPSLSCGRCRQCLSGLDQMCDGSAMMGFVALGQQPVEAYARYHDGFIAEYARAPQRQVDRLTDNVSFDAGAKLHYLANALRNLRVAALPPASTLMILGATGSMGVATVKMAKYFGVARLVLVGRSLGRLEPVRALSNIETVMVATDELGEDWAATGALARKMAELPGGRADAVIDYVPNGGDIWQAVNGLATGGTIVNMAGGPTPFSYPMRMMVARCWKVAGTRNHSRLDAHEVLRHMASGDLVIDDLITHKHPLGQVAEAIEAMKSRSEQVWMSVVHP